MNKEYKVAVVTDGGSGIGRGTALALAKNGYRVSVAGRQRKTLEETIAQAGQAAAHMLTVPTDVSDPAGNPFEDLTYERQQEVVDANLTGSFNDYFMPRAGMFPDIKVSERPLPSKANVLGAKGVGESGCTASLPTLANAMMDALRPAGVPELDTPFTPFKVWKALQAANYKPGAR